MRPCTNQEGRGRVCEVVTAGREERLASYAGQLAASGATGCVGELVVVVVDDELPQSYRVVHLRCG